MEAWGFFVDREGALREAGVLPNGGLDAYGAVPAASAHGTNRVGNEVSTDGSRAFFVSPDPASCEQNGGRNDLCDGPARASTSANRVRRRCSSPRTRGCRRSKGSLRRHPAACSRCATQQTK